MLAAWLFLWYLMYMFRALDLDRVRRYGPNYNPALDDLRGRFAVIALALLIVAIFAISLSN